MVDVKDADTLLVLGGSGFLGAHVVAEAVKVARAEATMAQPYGTPVVGSGREPEKAPLFSDPRDAVQWIAADLAPEGAAQALLNYVLPRRVILCAALARAADCEDDRALAERMNTGLPAEVARWCAESGARLVHVSTDLVFGGDVAPAGGHREGDPVNPISVYGETKARGEQAVCEIHPPSLVVRLPLLYGNSGGRGTGASDSLLEAVEREECPGLFVDEWRTPLEVRNAAAALVEMTHAEHLRDVIHVAGPDRVTRHELGLAILCSMGLDEEHARAAIQAVHQADVPTKAARPRDVSLNASRVRDLIETELHGVEAGTLNAVR